MLITILETLTAENELLLLYTDPIYQPLRSGRVLHKVNF